MPRQLRTRLVGIVIVSACGFTASNMGSEDSGSGPNDSSVDAYIPDAGDCLTMVGECIGSNSTLRECRVQGQPPTDVPCSWGCLTTPAPHCAQLVPSGGAVTAGDLDHFAMLEDKTIIAAPSVTINTDDGSISNGVRLLGTGVKNGIEYKVVGNIAVFRFNKLTVNGATLYIRGTRAAALVSYTDITINAEIDVQGDCSGVNAGPGGGSGGPQETNGNGSGSGGSGGGADDDCSGGGGGAHGGSGGDGGAGNNNGSRFGSDAIMTLLGGGGGGGGGGNGGGGGGGGGALQLVANQRITISGLSPFAGGINAGGCGGRTAQSCGGGGGAGGTILIEAPVIDFKSSTLAVNGGGGGGGSNGTSGQKAQLSTTKAAGGNGGNGSGQGNDGGDGGDGGDDNAATGGNGENQNRSGGGGGGVGRMRFNTLSGSIVTSGLVVFSPALSMPPGAVTTTTRGLAVVQ